jgi:excisionase family DNA binding protein
MTFTIKQVAEHFGVSPHTVLAWIRSGELLAINVGRSPNKLKPRWRVSSEALADWEFSRSATPAMPRVSRRKRTAEIIDFIK